MTRKPATFTFRALAFLLVAITGCSADWKFRHAPNATYALPPAGRLEGVTEFPYVASAEKQQRIVSGCSALHLGMPANGVLELLGAPDLDHQRVPKEWFTPIRGRTWKYYLRGRDEHLANALHDMLLILFFDRKGNLEEIVPCNMESFGMVNPHPIPR